MRYLLIAALLWAPACTYHMALADRSQKKTSFVAVSNNFYLWGWIGKGQIDMEGLCKKARVYKMEDKQNFGQIVLSFLSIGLVQLRTVRITCGSREDASQGAHLSEL